MTEIQPLPLAFIKEDKCFLPKLVPLHLLPSSTISKSTDLFFQHSYSVNINVIPSDDKKSEGHSKKESEGFKVINWFQLANPMEKKDPPGA